MQCKVYTNLIHIYIYIYKPIAADFNPARSSLAFCANCLK